MEDESIEAFISDQEIRTATEDTGWDRFLVSVSDEGSELFTVGWLDEVFRGATKLQPGVGSKRDVLPNSVRKRFKRHRWEIFKGGWIRGNYETALFRSIQTKV